MFTTVIDSHQDLTNVENLQHLRSCLRDAALETIRSLEISDGNHAIALDLRQNRFDNRRLVNAVQSGSVSTLQELSDKFNARIRVFKGLGTTEKIAGCVIVQVLFQRCKVGRAFRGPYLRQLSSYVGSQWHHLRSSDAERWRLWISPWQTMRRTIRWEISQYFCCLEF